MKSKFLVKCAFLALNLVGACASDEPNDAEIWQQPAAGKGEKDASVQPASAKLDPPETAEVQPAPVVEADTAARPWEPDASMGSEVHEAELSFEDDAAKAGPEEGEEQISDAFNPKAGYENDDALIGTRAPKTGGHAAKTGAPSSGARRNAKSQWVAAQSLNIRSGPSRRSPIVGTLSAGSTVKVLAESEGWSRIGPSRFVRSRFLTNRKN